MAVEHFEVEIEVKNVPVYVAGWVSYDGHLDSYLDIFDYMWEVSSPFMTNEDEGEYTAVLEDGTEVIFNEEDVITLLRAKKYLGRS